ncbi:DUF493 family protein [uncultured Microbulbifer sp.]|uniref:YbeD family protein n=1 Tax=uncultured Microbulbifer sp. TaxID=348147 RepID=UPI00261755E3|nr:DUF493 family protein [uncultured Microbulbifer sp.]
MTQDSQQQPPKIEFPCEDYVVKVVRDTDDQVRDFVLEVMRRHAPGLDESRLTHKPSRNGKFTSVTFYIVATGEPQLKALTDELTAHPGVYMVI